MTQSTVAHDGRICIKCGIYKNFAEFGVRKKYPDKRQATCKRCVVARQRNWERKNKMRHASNLVPLPIDMKCRFCGETKSADQFGRRANTKSGIDTACLECWRKKDRTRYRKDKQHRKNINRWANIKSNFGITREQWQTLIDAQNSQCAICQSEFQIGRRMERPCIDHDHATGRVRGLLCARCNQGIGLLRDNSDIATMAATYLKRHGK